jgi:hypothetical protein
MGWHFGKLRVTEAARALPSSRNRWLAGAGRRPYRLVQLIEVLGADKHVSQVLTIWQLRHINNKAVAELKPDKFGKQTD